MKCLFIDSSSSKRIVAISYNDNLLYYTCEDNGVDLSINMLPLIIKALDNTNISIKDIDRIMVVNGPGSFTGIRIGITIAKTLAWSFNIDIVSISELELMSSFSTDFDVIVPLIDARRNCVYAGIYDNNLNKLEDDCHIEILKLLRKLDKYNNITFVSYDNFENINNLIIPDIDILKVINKHINDEPINPHLINPIYLKNTEAEDKMNGVI